MRKALNLLLAGLVLVTLSISITACGGGGKADDAKDAVSAVGDTLRVTSSSSTIRWKGDHIVKGYSHWGTLAVKEGFLTVKDGTLTGGEFVIDMVQMAITDNEMGGKIDEKGAADLKSHLQSEDFFDVQKFPTAKFVVTGATALEGDADGNTHKIEGNLTIKDVTKNINFPVKVDLAAGSLKAEAKSFKVNRTDFGIKYGSSLMDNLKDRVIADDIELGFTLVANK